MLDEIQHATGKVCTGGVYLTTHTVRKRPTNKYPFGFEQELQIFMQSFGSFEIHQYTNVFNPAFN
jgi:hypothetical protein